MRIAFVHGRFPAGGAERITIDIARYLKGVGGYEVFVYTSRLNEGMMPAGLEDILTIRKLPSQAVQSNRSKAIEEFIKENGIDILVQVTKPVSGIEGIRQRTGCKTIVACYDGNDRARFHLRCKIFFGKQPYRPFAFRCYGLALRG